jgi:hypothetical protein
MTNISTGNKIAQVRKSTASSLLLFFILALTLPAAQAQKFTLQRLNPPGSHYSFALGVNIHGLVVGSFVNAKGVYKGFVYNGSDYREISESASFTQANGVNDNMVVVGDFMGKDNLMHGFFLRAGQFTPYDVKPGPDEPASTLSTYMTAINNAGNFVGYTQKQGKPAIAYVNNGTVKHFTFQGNYTFAEGIDTNNEIVGWFIDSNFLVHGFYRAAGGKMTQIDYPGAPTTVCLGINDMGQITGYYVDTEMVQHGFIRTNGKFRTVGPPDAAGINNSGVFVGGYIAKNKQNYGFIATPQ